MQQLPLYFYVALIVFIDLGLLIDIVLVRYGYLTISALAEKFAPVGAIVVGANAVLSPLLFLHIYT